MVVDIKYMYKSPQYTRKLTLSPLRCARPHRGDCTGNTLVGVSEVDRRRKQDNTEKKAERTEGVRCTRAPTGHHAEIVQVAESAVVQQQELLDADGAMVALIYRWCRWW